MSQPGNYRYQTYDQSNALKGAISPTVNGQPHAMYHPQNGLPPTSFNSAGTPSSQSSRDPSRETSRDPSPTQYIHNQYRPQLTRPPMPPINGQRTSSQQSAMAQQPLPLQIPPVSQQQTSPLLSPMTQQQHSTQPSQSTPLFTVQNPKNQLNNVQTSNTAVFPRQTKILTLQSSIQSAPLDLETSSLNLIQRPIGPTTHNISDPHEKSQLNSSSTTGTDGQDRPIPMSQLGQQPSGQASSQVSQTQGQSFDTQANWNKEQVHSISNSTNQTSDPTKPKWNPTTRQEWTEPKHSQTISQVYSVSNIIQSQPGVTYNRLNTDSSSITLNSTNTLIPGQTWKNATGDLQNSQSMPQSFASSLQPGPSPRTQAPPAQNPGFIRSPVSAAVLPPTTSYLQQLGTRSPLVNLGVQDSSTICPQATPSVPGMNTSMQNVFGNLQTNQGPNQKLPPGPPLPQDSPLERAEQQQSILRSNQANQTLYGSQQNVASQWKYQQPGYSAETGSSRVGPPPVSAASNPGDPLTVPEHQPINAPNAPPTNYGTRPPPLSGQQSETPYDFRSPYYGQMRNVPLDNMNKRYPTTAYPDPTNQLNTQMANLNVTQSGFNDLWGQQSINLLQCRNILPAERVEPPRIKLQQEFLDSINCSPEIFRCTLTKIPESNSLLQKCRLPLGVLIHPFKDLNHLPVIQCSTIVRCRACRTYINPFIYFVDSKRWKCNLCYRVNELPDEFQFDPVTKSYGDPSRRPEVKTSTIEFIAPGEYMLRPPQPAVYLFIIDVSKLAVDSGYLSVVCETIGDELTKLPGDGRTQVGFMAIDSAIHFFSMPENVSQPHELIMLDVDDVFLPCPDNLIVNLKEREELIRDLLEQLPVKFNETHDTNSALGAGLQAAYKLMSPTGGRVTVFQTCLPNLGPGALQAREDPNTRASKDVPHLNPATDFYKRLALDCSGQQIAVDLFLLNSQYSDLATLSGMCKFSGGCIYHIPLFRRNRPQHSETLEKILRRYLTRKIGFEAVMRIRCTRGLSIHTFHGNFFVRSTDLLSLPNVNPDAGFGMQVSIEENLSDVQSVCFQAALLYTSSKGERRIRVHTMCLPVTSSMSDILYSADQQAIIGLLSKMAVDRSQQSSLSDARDALINVAIDVLSAYKLSQSSSSGGLMAPINLKLLPLYIIALIKSVAYRTGMSTRLDDRIFSMCQMKTLPLGQLMQTIYPDLYPVHALDNLNAKDIEGRVCPQPPRLHLSAEKLDFRGVFLMDAGDKIFLYVGKSVDPGFCFNVLGVSAYSSIPEEMYDLPELETVENERLRNFVFSLQEEKPYYASLQIIRDDSHFRSLFTERLIEDRSENALSYFEFLQHLKTQVK
ncbi:protein transport protein Sec24A [Venturia canescens]|uniref:protein transport protein Sec24A n=1 Tax=Venturia canescens TaxID=32260 RepID=UPI001C9C61CB|nr:protein transport protein Sec24A [Venturia canescens]XP_043277321.1 protein transport protein Sec24A [Venturia canescens]XP_043277322.1 protein transport protein Sec24A [Venturia canescens]XP_043277323.1 protein transport protein Sec24A [Venturia canescens]